MSCPKCGSVLGLIEKEVVEGDMIVINIRCEDCEYEGIRVCPL